MVFSSPTFLFVFFPLVLGIWLLFGRSKFVLLVASIIYYGWDQPEFVLLLGGVIFGNYFIGEAIGRGEEQLRRRLVIIGITANILVLGYFKYASFLIMNWNVLADTLRLPAIPVPEIALPLGVSFFTFQALAYLIDIYTGQIRPANSLFRYALFKAFFPQLIAGPIVRYQWVAEDFRRDLASRNMFVEGVERFVIGLAKKAILADTLAVSVDSIFNLPTESLTMEAAWLGSICFALQIYFDFSGYTDMAIGLGRMFGIRLPENFLRPYEAVSLQDFWRRWHVTLSTWFRDYVYFPLGGSRCGSLITFRNLLVVFALCGLWHGATWGFVVWGLYHGAFLILERTRFSTLLRRLPTLAQHIYALLIVLVGWVIFRSPTLEHALGMMRAMISFPGGTLPPAVVFDPLAAIVVCLGLLCSFPSLYSGFGRWLPRSYYEMNLSALLVVSIAFAATQTHRAFIYFRF